VGAAINEYCLFFPFPFSFIESLPFSSFFIMLWVIAIFRLPIILFYFPNFTCFYGTYTLSVRFILRNDNLGFAVKFFSFETTWIKLFLMFCYFIESYALVEVKFVMLRFCLTLLAPSLRCRHCLFMFYFVFWVYIMRKRRFVKFRYQILYCG